MVVIICTDEFYPKSGKLASKKQSHQDEKEGEEKMLRNKFDNAFPPLFCLILLMNILSAVLICSSRADQKLG